MGGGRPQIAPMSSQPAPATWRSRIASFRRPRRLAGSIIADWAALVPLALLVLLLLLGPALNIVLDSLRDDTGRATVENWLAIIAVPLSRRAILGSLRLGAMVATLSTLIGGPLAWAVSRLRPGRRSLGVACLTVAANLPATALAFGFSAAFGAVGLFTLALQTLWPGFAGADLYDSTGVVLVFLYFHVPLYVLLTLPAMGVVSERLWEAAIVCGAGPRLFWRRVGLPMLLPFLAAGWFLVFVWAISQYGVPLALGGVDSGIDLISVRIGALIETAGRSNRFGQAACLSILLIALSILALALYYRLLRRAARWIA
jgi:putative spermidine/putrescine transport system permease protein